MSGLKREAQFIQEIGVLNGIIDAERSAYQRLQDDNKRLRAHIQDAADKHTWCIGVCDYPEDKQVHKAIRDWHLAALAPR